MEKTPNNRETNFDILINEKIGYNDYIKIDSKDLEEVHHYSRTFITKRNYKMCSVRLSIPLTGNSGNVGARSRILLYLDDEVICDGSIHNGVSWELRPINLIGEIFDLKAWEHKIKLLCCVNDGILYIPCYNRQCIEHTLSPKLTGKLIVLGFK